MQTNFLKRKFRVQIFEVVGRGADYSYRFCRLFSSLRYFYFSFSGKIFQSSWILLLLANSFLKVFCFPLTTTSPPCLPSFRTKVNQKIGGENRFFIMLHHDNGITKPSQRLQGFYQPVGVPFVQADSRLVQT